MQRPGYLSGFAGIKPRKAQKRIDAWARKDSELARQRESYLRKVMQQLDKIDRDLAKMQSSKRPNTSKINRMTRDKQELMEMVATLQKQIACLRG